MKSGFSTRIPLVGRPAGLTLIELVVVVAILAVLTALAVPSYQRYAQRSQRAEAVRVLLELAACQEGVRAETGFYDTHRCTEALNNGHYRFRIEPLGQAQTLAFRAIASPVERIEGDSCGELHLDHTGYRGIGKPGGRPTACWGGR